MSTTRTGELVMSSLSKAGAARLVPTRSLLVRDIQLLATLDTELGDIRDAAIYIEGNVIKWVGASTQLTQLHQNAEETISLSNRVVIPGLINTHHHMFGCLTRCLAQVLSAHSPNHLQFVLKKYIQACRCHRMNCCLVGWRLAMVHGNN